jgi:hypothetical protein
MELAYAVTFMADGLASKTIVVNTFPEVARLVKLGNKSLMARAITTSEWRCDSVNLLDRLSKGECVTISRFTGGKYAIQVDVQAV